MTQRRRRDDKRGAELLRAALGYAKAGIPVIPLHSINARGACTCGKAKCGSTGKHPRIKHGLKEASADEAQIRKWWERWPEANVGGVLGDRFVAIDVDVAEGKGGEDSLCDLEDKYGEFPKTARAKTGRYGRRRGRHYFFTTEGGVGSGTGILGHHGIDLRGKGGYVVLPPSRHRSGVDYEWEVSLSKAAAMPEALEEALRSKSGSEASERDSNWKPSGMPTSKEVRELLLIGDWDIGKQRAIATRCARALLDSGASPEAVVNRLLAALDNSDKEPDDPWTRSEVEELVKSEVENPPPPLEKKRWAEIDLSLSDEGNAERFAQRFKDEARYVPEWKSWVFWEGDRWRNDDELLATQRMLEVVRAIPQEINDLDTDDDLKAGEAIYRWAKQSRAKFKIQAAVGLAQAHPDLVARAEDFDSDPNLLNCRNGTLHLKTGELRPHDRADMLTRQTNCDFDPDAASEDWERVLADAFDGDAEITDYLRRVFGYSLTGDTSEESLFFFHGKPGAGKGTILDSFHGMLGDYASSINAQTLTKGAARSGSDASEDIARLDGVRFALANEFDPRDDFAAAKVNMLTGRDKVAARFLNKGTFEFYPQFKIFVAANHLPKQPSSPDSGVWRRLKIVPFDHPVAKIDKDLKTRLSSSEARSAILVWALRGCLEWRQEGLGAPPERVTEAVEEYREESDPHRIFIEEALEESEGHFIPNGVMRDLYQAHAEANGIRRPVSPQKLTPILKERGLQQRTRNVTRDGRRTSVKVWEGFRIKGKSDQEQRSIEGAC